MALKRSSKSCSLKALSQVCHPVLKSRQRIRLPNTLGQHPTPLRARTSQNSSDFGLLCAYAHSDTALPCGKLFKDSTKATTTTIENLHGHGASEEPAAPSPRPRELRSLDRRACSSRLWSGQSRCCPRRSAARAAAVLAAAAALGDTAAAAAASTSRLPHRHR